MNFFTVAQLVALVAAQNSIEWSTYSFYSSLAGDYQCLLAWLPDSDAQTIAADPSSFIEKFTASPATDVAALLGLTTGCTWTGTSDATATATDSAESSSAPAESSEEVSETAPETGVASANRAAAGVAGAGAMAAAFLALM